MEAAVAVYRPKVRGCMVVTYSQTELVSLYKKRFANVLQFKRWRMCNEKRTLVKLSLCARNKMRMFPILKSGIHTGNDTAARYKMCTAQFPEAPVEEKLVFAK